MGSACSCWRSTARPALTTSVAKCTVNYCATSWRDSTIIAPVSVCHRASYTYRYSRSMRQGIFGTAMRSLVAVGTLVSAVVLGACANGSGTTLAATVGVTTATVVAVQTAALTFPNGRMFDP